MRDPTEIVSSYWGTERTQQRLSWLQHPAILQHVNRRVTGNPSVPAVQWFRQQYFPRPVDLALSLGCGFGGFERYAFLVGIAQKFHAHDISEGAIAKARQHADELSLAKQLEYSVSDLDRITLPSASYDAIFALSSAHHVFHLENLFEQCQKALKLDGLLFLNEYVGPSRFQTSEATTELINRLRDILPERYRKSLFANDGSLIHPYAPSPPEHFEKHDPSEAVRSGELVETLKTYFDIVEYRPYGGAVMHMLFSGIMGNFDENNEADVALLHTIASFEEALEKLGIIKSDFAAIVAKPKQIAG